jgi:RecA-family ATPase
MEGDPKVNKTSVDLDLAARVSTGSPMPGKKTKIARGGVLILAAEDSIQKTLTFRLQAAGADMNRVGVFREPLTIPEDVSVIEVAAAQIRARLIIVDPLTAFLARDANKDQEVRQALMPLKAVAERYKFGGDTHSPSEQKRWSPFDVQGQWEYRHYWHREVGSARGRAS